MQATIPGVPVPETVPAAAAKPKRVPGPAEQRLRARIALTRRVERLVAQYDRNMARAVLLEVSEALWAVCQEETRVANPIA